MSEFELVKVRNVPGGAGSLGGFLQLSPWIQVSRATGVLPQSTTEMLFRVSGGRIACLLILGEATVVLTSTDPVLSLNSTALSAADATIGTTTVLASTVSLASLEVGGYAVSQNAGTALVKANAGGYVNLALNGSFAILPAGEIYCTTTGNNTTGKMKWDLWYRPLDPAATVSAKAVGTAII